MNYLMSQGKTMYLSVEKKTKVLDIAGYSDFFNGTRFRYLASKGDNALYEITKKR